MSLTAQQASVAEPELPERQLAGCKFCTVPVRAAGDLGMSVAPAEIPTETAYFSRYSDSSIEHARAYSDLVVDKLKLCPNSFVADLASNDGYLLQLFLQRGMRVLGVEPARNLARVAEARGVPTAVDSFGVDVAQELRRNHGRANLIIGNNVLGKTPDLSDFVAGIPLFLAWNGTVTLEFPHLPKLSANNLFDRIYHIFALHCLRVFDVEEVATHGGSLRVWGCHAADPRRDTARLRTLRARALAAGANAGRAIAALVV